MKSKQRAQPTYEEIAACAYLIWEKEGRPHGRDVAHWLQAEEHLLADRLHDAGMLVRYELGLIPALTAKPKTRFRGFRRAAGSLQEVRS